MSFVLDKYSIAEKKVFQITVETETSYQLNTLASFFGLLDFYYLYANYVAACNSGVEFSPRIKRIFDDYVDGLIHYRPYRRMQYRWYMDRDIQDEIREKFADDTVFDISPEVLELAQGSIKISIMLPIVLLSLCGLEFDTDGISYENGIAQVDKSYVDSEQEYRHKSGAISNNVQMKKTHVKIKSLGEGIEDIAHGIRSVRRAFREK